MVGGIGIEHKQTACQARGHKTPKLACYRFQYSASSAVRWRAYRGRTYLAWGDTKKTATEQALRKEQQLEREAKKPVVVKKPAAKKAREAAAPSAAAVDHKPVSRYRNVRARWTGTAWKWEGYTGGHSQMSSLGLHSHQLQASRAVAAEKNVDVSTLLIPKRERMPEGQSMRRMSAVCKVFADWCPADLASAIVARKRCGLMRQAAPGLWQALLHGKEEPWHIAVHQAWEATPAAKQVLLAGLGSGDRDMEVDGAMVMHGVLARAFVCWSRLRQKHPGPGFWSTHVNKNVSFHHGLLPWAQQSVKLLRKQTHKAGSLAEVWQPRTRKPRQAAKKWYAVIPFRPKVHRQPLVQLHRQGLLFNALVVPRKTSEWRAAQEAALKMAEQIGMKTKGQLYHWPWIVRANLLTEARHHGVRQLQVDQDWDEEQVETALAPDQSGWMPLWVHSAGGSLKRALAKLNYDGPVEMAACLACMAGDSALEQYAVEELEGAAEEAITARTRFCKEHRFEGNPCLIFQDVLGPSSCS